MASTNTSSTPSPQSHPLPERFFTGFFRLFAWLERLRKEHPLRAKVAVVPINMLLSAAVVYPLTSYVEDWYDAAHPVAEVVPATPAPATPPAATATPIPNSPSAGTVAPNSSSHTRSDKRYWVMLTFKTIVSFVSGLAVSEMFLRGAVPALRYAWQASSMREIGLHLVISDPSQFCSVVSRFVNEQDKNHRIRVICISGKYLFAQQTTPSGHSTPLYDHARRGVLDVIMPVTSADNITIGGRYQTYSDLFKKEHGYKNVGSLAEEVAEGKLALKVNAENTFVEHNILCMWRVVLLDKYCVVQTYFPNNWGKDSNQAPIFVFEKSGAAGDHGYYATFNQMFELISSLHKKA